MRRAAATLALALTLALQATAAETLSAQGRGRRGGDRAPGPEGGGAALELGRHEFAAVAVSSHPWSTLVAITLAFPDGSEADPRDGSGTAWLLGQTVRDALAARLRGTGASVEVQVGRTETVFQVTAAPGRWRESWDALMDGALRATLGFETLGARRAELLEVFAFEDGAPTREFQRELAALLGDGETSWARDPRGTAESVAGIDASDLAALRRRIYRPDDAVVTLVGAVDAEPGVRVYAGGGGDGGEVSFRRRGGNGTAWERGRRERSVHEVTNGWIGAAFPARGDVSRTAIEFIVDRLRRELNPVPRDPGLYGAEARLEDHPDGPVIVIEAAVLPDDQARWEERIESVFETIEARYRDASFFTLHRRQFRSEALIRQSDARSEGRRLAHDLLTTGRARDFAGELAELEAEQVLRALDTLGDPRVLVFGPRLDG